MEELELARWLFAQVETVASRQKAFNLAAATFLTLSGPAKIQFMNEAVFPEYEAAGSPAPYTAECLNFTSSVFTKRTLADKK